MYTTPVNIPINLLRMGNLKQMESGLKVHPQNKKFFSAKFLLVISSLFLFLILFDIQASPLINSSYKFSSWALFNNLNKINITTDSRFIAKLQDSITFMPLKDLRFSDKPTEGHTWYMSSLNDTYEENEAQHLYFPSEASKGQVLCMKGHDHHDGTKNFYALAYSHALPDSAVLLKGLTFISDTYDNYQNLWHGLCAMSPFVAWSIKNDCSKPTRWVLSHWGEFRTRMGSWLEHLMETNFGKVEIEIFENENVTYCFENAVVMRHDYGQMGPERKLQVFDSLRCKARKSCGLNPKGKGKEVNEKGVPIVRVTLLLRRGSRAFKNPTLVRDIFAKVCEKIEGCVFSAPQSEDLSFCDQVKIMTNTDIVVTPHGAQLTNQIFMDRGSSIMEFFPKGWHNLAGPGQFAHHWLANMAGMKHEGGWWDSIGDECPNPKNGLECFMFHKDGQVGHNETYFSEWGQKVIKQVTVRKREESTKAELESSDCAC